MRNRLYCGDNLDVLRRQIDDASVDLVYLDPPFQSGRDYHAVFEPESGTRRVDSRDRPRAPAFHDTWRWGADAEALYDDVTRAGSRAAVTLQALRAIVGESEIMAYLCMMAPRLLELRRALKPSGSLYLHCDPTASHYLKILLDGIFGAACFRNEIVWRYRRWPTKARRFQRMHDVLLCYTARPGSSHTFHTLYGYERLADSTLKTFGTKKQRADFSSGRRKPGVEEGESPGPPLSDVWEVGVIAAIGRERTGFPTQKPEALLERVIRASSSEGDVVLDPFCGSGTTIAVAERLRRRWIGIDVAPLAIEIVRSSARFAAARFDVSGVPGATAEVSREGPLEPFPEGAVTLPGVVGIRPRPSEVGAGGALNRAARRAQR